MNLDIKLVNKVAYYLVIVGGLNWGMVAFNLNLVEALFGSVPMLVTLVYVLVGASTVLLLVGKKK
ncbi:hypothetical protein LBMAG33_3660 [Candidatus Levyibacteriota bacterium]|nr:DUF378 domain-containing protein [Candidatus Levybacteria bacterium]MSU26004.1 DUF378 domain-containing protein [Candidatus Levybacteria bacterium]GDX62056.1 hypothetical protein LBMAG33_3660 [Candidatus Levybacteria bacterium]